MRTTILAFLAVPLMAAATTTTAPAQTAPEGVRGELLAQLDDAASKLEQLAQAIPQEKYSWRPSEGVRCVSEALMHVANANLYFPTLAGYEPTMQMGRDLETSVTDKAEVIDILNRTFDEMRAAIRKLPDSDLDKPANMFGRETTYRGVYMSAVMHAHEHLGQLIAYARTNEVVPPWSASSGG